MHGKCSYAADKKQRKSSGSRNHSSATPYFSLWIIMLSSHLDKVRVDISESE
jgi:hypothetical protein